MSHLVLLGDSTLDNAAYVRAGQDVTSYVRSMLPPYWNVTMLALDGGVIADIERQLEQLPADSTCAVVSVGGNDALLRAGIVEERAASMADALTKLALLREEFGAEYGTMLNAVARRCPTAICTIYEGAFPDPHFARLATTALALLNDCITREASTRGLPLVDLRVICDRTEDFANPIESSGPGGRKIAAAIVDVATTHDFGKRRCEMFANSPLFA